MTESDKLDIAKYVVELLTTALRNHGPYDSNLGAWMERAQGECIMRDGNYLTSINRIGR